MLGQRLFIEIHIDGLLVKNLTTIVTIIPKILTLLLADKALTKPNLVLMASQTFFWNMMMHPGSRVSLPTLLVTPDLQVRTIIQRVIHLKRFSHV